MLELILTAASFFIAYYIRTDLHLDFLQEVAEVKAYFWLLPVIVVIWAILLWINKSYVALRLRGAFEETFILAKVIFFGSIVIYALITIVKAEYVNRTIVGLFDIVNFILLFTNRQIAKAILLYYAKLGYDKRFVLVIGTSEKARTVASRLKTNDVYEVRDFISEDVAKYKLQNILQEKPVDEVYLIPTTDKLEDTREILNVCDDVGIKVNIFIDTFSTLNSRPNVENFGQDAVITLSSGPRDELMLFVKRLIDIFASLMFLIFLLPILLSIAFAVKVTSKGNIIFKQERAGIGGRKFTFYKFRTMYAGADKERFELEKENEMAGPVFKIKEDPRITKIGKLLRKFSIDELPQLWNVLKGDMSLVGPRPLPVYEVAKFQRWQRRRMSMRPGITCIWQVEGRNVVNDFTQWVAMDLQYVDNWSLWLDFKLLVKTIPAVISGKGAY
ncbi:sugar transferase [Candidatus Peregrinibacteria bacterium]|nr:sugar transferase [Candidatus Peregrinibacteria bacterium]